MFLTLKNGTKIYGSGAAQVNALDGIDFGIEKGKICVILGPSGSGKSTLMNMIGGIDTLDSGTLEVNGKTVSAMNRKQLTEYRRNDIGFVFQSYNLIDDLSARENIQVVADICRNHLEIDEIMDSLGISELSDRFPKELSGGQQQRIAIARAMVKNPSILLCDELTGALDSRSSRTVLAAVENLNRVYGTTVLIITHNTAIAGMADQVTYIKDGKITKTEYSDARLSAAEIAL